MNPYAAAFIGGRVAIGLPSSSTSVVMGPCVRRDDTAFRPDAILSWRRFGWP